ncbi:protein fem-1 homolog C [Coccinella septempunctata]|uniref:protein fem-1 homolog C n=1 Tax=Coccinella septempunctata TaxID=41139 RepID=UPI001D05C63B|nr:protein fem-1 homolog C [Coccinella septempunctata]
MWELPKLGNLHDKDIIFLSLMNECRKLAPGSRLSCALRNKLSKLSLQERSEIVNRSDGGCSPLFVVCRRGQTEIVEYLITFCNANIEQRGLYEVADDRSTHMVTPLWCAAVSGKLKVVEFLLKQGADINAVSDTGSTPVRSACFMTHLEVVKYLVEHGADINLPNYNGGTCLINSVQSSLLCEFLLRNGADVNARDIQNKTALHYAIQEHRLETTRLLLKNGANIHARSRYGDDALQTACLKGAGRIFEYLTTNFSYSSEKLANAHELLGATYLDEHNDTFKALEYWRLALTIRETHGLLPKQPVMPLLESYRFQREFQSMEELENMSGDLDAIRIQSLLIAERILGSTHKDTIFRLMYRGASYADMVRHQHCIHLWRRALEIRTRKDSILYSDTCFTAQALVRLMIDFNEKHLPADGLEAMQRFKDILETYKLLTDDIIEVRHLLTIRPVYKRQADFFDKILKCITHLIYLMIENAVSKEQKDLVEEHVKSLIQIDPRTVGTQDSLLHLCVSKMNTIWSSYFIEEEPVAVFPRRKVLELLLRNGASVTAKNKDGSTPLHIATFSCRDQINLTRYVKLLLDYGAHIDQPNRKGMVPTPSIMEHNNHTNSPIPILDYVSLKCLCATAISKYGVPYKNQIPRALEEFMHLHEPT